MTKPARSGSHPRQAMMCFHWLRGCPVMPAPPGQWELIFDRYERDPTFWFDQAYCCAKHPTKENQEVLKQAIHELKTRFGTIVSFVPTPKRKKKPKPCESCKESVR